MRITLSHTAEYDVDTDYEVDGLPVGWDRWSMHDQEEWTVSNGVIVDSWEQPGDTILYHVGVN